MTQPVIVSIWSTQHDADSFRGSGCLLTTRHVLTAKHLVNGTESIYVGLIPGAADRYRAVVLDRHQEHDAALLKLDAETPLPVTIPTLLTEHRSLAGEQVHLLAISPLNKSRHDASGYSIGSYDEIHGEYELSPDNARGHSGGVVLWKDAIVGLLFARATDDPLCRAIALHRLWPWISRALPDIASDPATPLLGPPLTAAWSGTWLDAGEIILVRPRSLFLGAPVLINSSSGDVTVTHLTLIIAVMRDITDGVPLEVPEFTWDSQVNEIGLAWQNLNPGHFQFSETFTIRRGQSGSLPPLNLVWTEDDSKARRRIDRLVGLASLSVQLRLIVRSNLPQMSISLQLPLRVLDGPEKFGESGVELLVNALAPETEARRSELLELYNGTIDITTQVLEDYRQSQSNSDEVEKLEQLADSGELMEFEEEISLAPSDPGPHLRIAREYLKHELPLAATKSLGVAWTLGLSKDDQLLEYADMSVELEARDQALMALKDTSFSPPYSPRYHGLRGEALSGEATMAEALADLDQAVELEPGCARWHFRRGLALYHFDERQDEALREFESALELGWDPRMIQVNRAITLLNLKRFDEAVEACKLALAAGMPRVSLFETLATLMPAAYRRKLLEILGDTPGTGIEKGG